MLDQHLDGPHVAVGGAPVDRPDDVAEPPAQVVGDVLGRTFAQRVEDERVSPAGRAQAGDEAEDQVLTVRRWSSRRLYDSSFMESPSMAAPCRTRPAEQVTVC